MFTKNVNVVILMIGIILSSVAHLALKAEDGDAQKHGGRDANAQHHRLGVVETVGNMTVMVSKY